MIKHKNFLQTKQTLEKALFFFRKFQMITVLLLIRNCYTGWITRFKIMCGFFHFWFLLVLLIFTLCSTKSMGYSIWLSNRHNSFQNKNNRKVTSAFLSRQLIFKLQQKVWKFDDIWTSWSPPKTDLEKKFLNLQHRSFEYLSFSQ